MAWPTPSRRQWRPERNCNFPGPRSTCRRRLILPSSIAIRRRIGDTRRVTCSSAVRTVTCRRSRRGYHRFKREVFTGAWSIARLRYLTRLWRFHSNPRLRRQTTWPRQRSRRVPMALNETLAHRVRAHAFGTLTFDRREMVNLYLDERIYNQGETIGPAHQEIVAQRPSILVFADDEPGANFGHTCRYLLYDANTGNFHREAPARFPPIADVREPKTLHAFHEPVQFQVNPVRFKLWPPIWRCPIIIPEGTRYAILFSGMSNKRHLNDMEFLYRTLIDIYHFDAAHIYVLNYDGTLNTQDGVQVHWPGDGTAYRIHVTGQGNRAGFEAAIDNLKTKLKPLDTLLIHCNNHGDSDTPDGGTTWVPGTSYLCTYPSWGTYHNADFSNKLGELPKFRQLIVMLEQCHAG